ncbi:MAG: hypothetical protein Q7S43_05330 [bacterium]|nr:hypothetical protein [bacterium]
MDLRRDYQAALALRLEGKTYGEIRRSFKIPKSTLSTWFSKLKISNRAKKILESKKREGYLKLLEFNKTRTVNIKKENEKICSVFKSKIEKLSDRELLLIGAVLYWGEGQKNFTFKKYGYPIVSFSNSDPKMIQVFIKFLESILGFPKDRMRAQVMIYSGINSLAAIDYWHNVTRIPKENISYFVALSRASKGIRPKNLLPYGTLQIRINRRQEFFKIRGLMDGIIKAAGF